MTARPKTHSAAGVRNGFSLIELLVVIAIVGILTVSIMPALQSSAKSTGLGIAASALRSELNYCRAEAVGLNRPVELCFLRKTDAEAGCFEQYRTRILEQDGSERWITQARSLPEGIAVSSEMALSNILGSQTVETDAQGREVISLRVLPSGEVELDPSPGTPLFFTLGSKTDLLRSPGTLPKNFVTIQIDARNAQTTVHRP